MQGRRRRCSGSAAKTAAGAGTDSGRYYEASRKLLPDRILSINGSAEPAVLDGMDIVMIPGDEGNFKITTREDLERFCRLVEERESQREGPAERRAP